MKLQSDGGITIGKKHYQSPDELKKEKNSAQIDLIKKAMMEKDSTLLVWLSDIYGDKLESTDTFSNLSIPEQFFLLGLLPFLSFKELNGSSLVLQELIDSYPGRSDFFKIYAAQGLPLTGQNIDRKTPIDYAVCNYKKLRNHGPDTIRNMIRLLCKLGADVNECSSNGRYPLIDAHDTQNDDLVKLLLELGADENQYREYLYNQLDQARIRASTENEYQNLAKKFLSMNGYKDTKALADDCENHCRILKERREEQERIERERRAEEDRIIQERNAEEERKIRVEKRVREAEQRAVEIVNRVKAFTPIFFAAIYLLIVTFIGFNIDNPSDVWVVILLILLFAVPFLIVYFVDYDYHPFTKVIFLIIGIIISILLFYLSKEISKDDIEGIASLAFVGLALSNLLACVTAMIFPKSEYW